MSQTLIRAWPSLRSPGLRAFVAGQAVSLVGTAIQQVAMGWLVYRTTHSAFLLGLVVFLSEFPGAVMVTWGGVLADRMSPRTILLATQSAAMVQAFVLAALVATGNVTVPVLLVLLAVAGALNGLDVPARHVLVTRLVDNDADLRNAIALNSLIFDAARLIGPPIGGLLVAGFGEWLCFTVNGLSFAAVIAALASLTLLARRTPYEDRHPLRMLADGARYAASSAPMRSILLLVAAVCFAAAPYWALLPIMTGQVLAAGPTTLGILMASMPAGSLCAAFVLGRKARDASLPRVTALGGALYAIGLIGFGASPFIVASIAALAIAGFGVMIFMATNHMNLIAQADEAMRGRVLSLFTLSVMGSVPLGGLCGGWLAQRVGAPATLVAGGVLCLLAAAVYFAGVSPGPAAPARG